LDFTFPRNRKIEVMLRWRQCLLNQAANDAACLSRHDKLDWSRVARIAFC
jgi:hypothetical protein